jgi:hypothetical protein
LFKNPDCNQKQRRNVPQRGQIGRRPCRCGRLRGGSANCKCDQASPLFFLHNMLREGAEISCHCTPTAPRGSPIDRIQIYQGVGPNHLKISIMHSSEHSTNFIVDADFKEHQLPLSDIYLEMNKKHKMSIIN